MFGISMSRTMTSGWTLAASFTACAPSEQAFTSSTRSKIGFLVSRPATELLRHHLDPNNHNGAVFLGLNGVVVKSHGSANALGVANAVAVAARLLEDDLTQRIHADLARVGADGLLKSGRNGGKSSAAKSEGTAE